MANPEEQARQSEGASANGHAPETPSPPPAPGAAAKDPGEELAHLYAQRRAKAAATPPTRDPRELLAELAAAQRASGAQEPTSKDPRQRLGELAAQQRVKRARGQDEQADSATVPTAVSAAGPPAEASPGGQPAPRALPGDEEELERLRAAVERQGRLLADLERRLAERAAAPEALPGTIPAPSVTADDAASAAGPSAPTLSARLRARRREHGEPSAMAPVPPEPSKPPPDDQPPAAVIAPPAVIPPIQGTDQPASPSEQDSSKESGGEPDDRRRSWLLVLPVLAVLILGLLAVAQLRPHGPSTIPTTTVAAPVPTVAAPTVTIAAPTASLAARASTASIAAPVGTAPVAAVLTAEGVSIARSTATALPTATPSPTATSSPISTPSPAATPSPAPSLAPASATALLARVADAEAALRSGQLAATIVDGSGTQATATLAFDFGDGTQPPRLHLTATYASPAGTQSTEQITIGDQAWQRQANGQWAPASPQGVYESVQPYLPHVAAVANPALASGGSAVTWYDASRAVDVTLTVDAATGIPRTLQEAPREGGGTRRTTTYSAWNTPVDIRPPPST